MLDLPVKPLPWRQEDDARVPSFTEKIGHLLAWVASISICGFALLALALLGQRMNFFIHHSAFFAIAEVKVEGAGDELEKQVREAVAKIREEGQENLLTFDRGYAAFYIESLPRVRAARIVKEYPRTLRIEIDERVAVAMIHADTFYWVDREGVVLDQAGQREAAAAKNAPLTGVRAKNLNPGDRIDQPGLPEAIETIGTLEASDPQLAARFHEWHLDKDDELVGIMDHGIEVRLGSEGATGRLPVLAALLRDKPEVERSTYVDLRFSPQVVYR